MSVKCIYGSGYIGQSLGKYYVKRKVEKMTEFERDKEVLFFDTSETVLKNLVKEGYQVEKDFDALIEKCDVIFITVPTPTIDGKISLKAFHETALRISKVSILDGKLFVIKSTVTPKTTKEHFIDVLKEAGKPVNDTFGILYSPEFITEIAKSWCDSNEEIGFDSEDRIVLGEGSNKAWGDFFIKEFVCKKDTPILRTGYEEAEMIKYVSNTMLATKISFWNEIFLLNQRLNLNFEDVTKGVSLDRRIGSYGTVTGKAFGGKCLPKDLEAFIDFSQNFKEMKVLKSVESINNYMKENFGVRE